MNLCHGRLNALQMSFCEQKETVLINRRNEATVHNLTGLGRDNVAVAFRPDRTKRGAAIWLAGYEALGLELAEVG
ncbi:MAG: hypothetical protein F4Y41_02730 [Gammaproteobacteria bacterium]|nr:hypothetical protein [Gammaproteobacteria bacterium]MYF27817.1 hypothetical protein [Gammaproteobacteria bacterium]